MELIQERHLWDEALLTFPEPHILQSWLWGEFKTRYRWQVSRWLWRDRTTELPQAAAQVLIQYRGGLGLGYVPKGPLLDWGRADLVEAVLQGLETLVYTRKLLLLKIDPDVREDTPQGAQVKARLLARGWFPSLEQVQFRNTMILDLRTDLDTLMARMKPKWRYNLRLAVRKGVQVRQAALSELPLIYDLYAETAARDGFIIREASYYLEVWRLFYQAGLALPLIAEAEGTPLAALILFHFGGRAWYMYGASRTQSRELMPNYLLQWEAIRRARELGCVTYDLWGAPERLDESDPLWGVYRFKSGLGAEFVPHIGAYDFAPNRLWYGLYRLLRPRLLAWMQSRYHRQTGMEPLTWE